jgi:3-hydroxymyristoyl/3-hydroxydecanoyl-(acyl carrier protein) dehydratase
VRPVDPGSPPHELTRARGVVDAADPVLRGHFPGRPIYPGVALLGRVLAAWEHATGTPGRIAAVEQLRFRAPLAPGDAFEITLLAAGRAGWTRFTIESAGRRVAEGRVALAPLSAGER